MKLEKKKEWYFGTVFLKQYEIIFNADNTVVGFYEVINLILLNILMKYIKLIVGIIVFLFFLFFQR